MGTAVRIRLEKTSRKKKGCDRLKRYEGFLIDLDGTVFRGKQPIVEAVQFINELKARGLPYLFVTNNSMKRPEDVVALLTEIGVPATKEDVITSSVATAKYISDMKRHARLYVVGEVGLMTALRDEGHVIVDDDPEFVVMGLDRQVTYEKLMKASQFVRNGATFIATNNDVALPTENGLIPGNGSLVSVVTVSTGIEPTFIGKPEPIIIEQALELLGTAKEKTIMIGDNYHTDILAGIRAGIDTALIYTGVTTKEQVKTYEKKPTYALSSLAEWEFR